MTSTTLIERLRQYAQADDLHKDERDTLIAAADALEAAREDAWQPIETAPKDQAVLVTFAAGDIPAGQVTMPGVMVAYWDSYYAIGGNGHDGIGRGWVDAHSGEGCHLHYGHPTRWRQLPAPPAIDQARGKGIVPEQGGE